MYEGVVERCIDVRHTEHVLALLDLRTELDDSLFFLRFLTFTWSHFTRVFNSSSEVRVTKIQQTGTVRFENRWISLKTISSEATGFFLHAQLL